jgi:hypothetical protein
MLPLLVWVAGCVFGLWLIWHEGYTREALAFVVCSSVVLWMVGGAAWIGRKLQAGAAARAASAGNGPLAKGIVLTDQDRELLKRAAAMKSSEQQNL